MASGCGMNILAKEMPGRFYDVGIEEEHAVTFAAGLAAGGMKPFCNIYSSFSQRAYDQIIHDVALQGLPVTLCLDRAGLVGEDGATHHGCYDMAVYRTIPGAVIAVPKDEKELKDMMYSAMQNESGPYIIRYPRGYGEGVKWKDADFIKLETGKGELLMDGSDIAVICAGPYSYRAIEAAREIQSEKGWNPAIYNIRYIKPLDEEMLSEIFSRFDRVITIEDGTIIGGLYGAVTEYAAKTGAKASICGTGIPDIYINQASQEEQRDLCGLTKSMISATIMKEFEKTSKKRGKVLEI